MKTLLEVLSAIGAIETVIFIGLIVYGVFLWAKGIFPALLRLGNGLATRRIAVFAKGDNLRSLKGLLQDSKLFREKNICEITKGADIGRAETATVFLVFWSDWAPAIDEVLRVKPDECALIVYTAYDQGGIPDEEMKKLDDKRHTTVTNFRGRLLNDIVVSMITTGCEKR